ncbi:hypothetical protein PG988_015065 [Apiospora saccharicola]|uniref:Uncharacterized protein n=1 Tax=Apiospora marii TaxID=335849 RepID=A0ABR1R012_9PEZI
MAHKVLPILEPGAVPLWEVDLGAYECDQKPILAASIDFDYHGPQNPDWGVPPSLCSAHPKIVRPSGALLKAATK